MKKSSLFLTLVAVTGLFLSSCSTFKNMGIEKRRYNKGFYVHVRDQKKNSDAVANTATTNTTAQPEAVAAVATQTPQVAAENTPVTTAAPVQIAATSNRHDWNTNNHKSAASASKPAAGNFKRALMKHELKKHNFASSSESQKGGDVDVALLVILAILIPPLAVYLSEGQLNSKFWIDLILCLLFFLPGIIYALIVVLG